MRSHSPPEGPHNGRLSMLSCALSLALLVACGQPSEEPQRAEAERVAVPAVASAVDLRIAIELPDTLARGVQRWAAERRARVEWMAADALDPRITLREIDAWALDALLETDALRAFGVAAEARLDELWLGEVGAREGRAWGIAWRAGIHALEGERLADWATLARLDTRLTLIDDQLTDTFLALTATLRAALPAGDEHNRPRELDAQGDAAVEALSFLSDLYDQASVASEGVPEHPPSGASHRAMRIDLRGNGPWQPFPAPSSESSGAVLARPKLLVLPRTGDHLDLGDELALWLTAPEQMQLLLDHDARRLPLHRAVQGRTPAQTTALATRSAAVAAPYRGLDAVHWNDLLRDAVRAAAERRRHPEAALADAARRRQVGGGP